MAVGKTKKEITQEVKLVYCKNCAWFKRSWIPPFTEKYIHPKNWISTWLEKIRRHPWEINRCNDCKWFEEKYRCSQSLSELRSKPD